jgi:ferric iron reductase protein FhuF
MILIIGSEKSVTRMDLTLAEKYFQLSTKGAEAPLLSIPATELLDRDKMRELLSESAVLLKGIGMELAVSFVGIGLFGLVASQQLIMSQYNLVLDLSLSNITVQLVATPTYGQIALKLGELRWTDLPENGRREAVEAEWRRYFQESYTPLIETVADAGGFKPDLIWNQYGAAAAYYIEYVRTTFAGLPMLQAYEADFEVMSGLPGQVFNRRKNPFPHTPTHIDSPYEPGKQLMIRSSCCMYYKREEGVKCYSCPLLKEDDRQEMKRKIEAELSCESAT